jgi:hypothetical protein
MLVVEDETPVVVGVEDNCVLVVEVVVPIEVADIDVVVVAVEAVVVPITVADVDVVAVAVVAVVVAAIVDAVFVAKGVVVVVAAAAVINALVVPVVGELAAVQLATGRLVQGHREGLVAQSCGFR